MVEYDEINCKLTKVKLNKLRKAVKSNEGASFLGKLLRIFR